MSITQTLKIVGLKTYEQHREHFKDRLNERFGICITDIEYDVLCSKKRKTVFGLGFKNICLVTINDIEIYCIWNLSNCCYTTAYPSGVGVNFEDTAIACFGKRFAPLLNQIHKQYLEECNSISDFSNISEAGKYLYENTIFAGAHLMRFKTGNVNMFKIMNTIKTIISDKSERVEMRLNLKK